MAEGRRRVKERFGVELEPEVQALGPVALPREWGRRMIGRQPDRRRRPLRRRRRDPRLREGERVGSAAAAAGSASAVRGRGR